MGNSQTKRLIKVLNDFNSLSQKKYHTRSDEYVEEAEAEDDMPFARLNNEVPVRLRFQFGYQSQYQSFSVVVTNQPQVFWASSIQDKSVSAQPRVLLLSQVKSVRQEDTFLILESTLFYDIELVFDDLEAKAWLAAIISHKSHPHGSLIFMSSNVKLSNEAKQLLCDYARPEFLGHNNFYSRKVRKIQQPPPDAQYGHLFGYAECRNAGKSNTNEDGALYQQGVFPRCRTPYTLFAIFDGHGGWYVIVQNGSLSLSLSLSRTHTHTHEYIHRGVSCYAQRKFVEIFEDVMKHQLDTLASYKKKSLLMSSWSTTRTQIEAILIESVIKLDSAIKVEKNLELAGSTVLLALKAKGEIWIACSGDSAATACTRNVRNGNVSGKMLHTQHTVRNERQRLQWIAAMRPELLGGCFSRRLFEPPKGIMKFHGSWRPNLDHIGSRVLHWDYHLTSAPMPTTICEEDVVVKTKTNEKEVEKSGFRTKAPMLSGSGDYMRLMGLLGCARGVGDHETVASCRCVPIKPFISSRPDVKRFDFNSPGNYHETYVALFSVFFFVLVFFV